MNKKKKKLVKFFGVILISIALVSIFIYWFLGLNYVLDAYQKITRLSGAKRDIAFNMFGGGGLGNSQVSGILLQKIGKGSLNGVLIWNLKGFHYFGVEKGAKYNSFSICEGRKWEQASAKIDKNVNINYDLWNEKAKRGDFVEVALSANKYLEDATVYDWWVFVSPPMSYFESTCKDR